MQERNDRTGSSSEAKGKNWDRNEEHSNACASIMDDFREIKAREKGEHQKCPLFGGKHQKCPLFSEKHQKCPLCTIMYENSTTNVR